jgi:hypothetical protein
VSDDDNEDPEILLNSEEYHEYRKHVGRLGWLSVETRPDLKFVVMKLQHRTASPTQNEMTAIQLVYRYLRATQNYAITLRGIKDQEFFAYADASHGDWPERKSTEGAVWFFGGAPIAWTSRKQTINTPSSTAAEWCALDKPARDAQWLKKIAKSLELEQADDPIVILTDNINTQLLMAKRSCKDSTRWLDMKWFLIRDVVHQGKVDLPRVDTRKNVADGFTKALDKEEFLQFTNMLCLRS